MSPGTFQAYSRLLVGKDKVMVIRSMSAWILAVTHTADQSVVRLHPLARTRPRSQDHFLIVHSFRSLFCSMLIWFLDLEVLGSLVRLPYLQQQSRSLPTDVAPDCIA